MSDSDRSSRARRHAPFIPAAAATLTGLLIVAGFVPALAAPRQAGAAETIVIYLMRHAETVPPPYEESPPDPHLRDAGTERAAALAHALSAEPITTVFSTDYNRTRETAAPVAAALGLSTTLYDPRDLDAFVERLRTTRGRHVVVGHSNTTPMVVEALGGDPGAPIEDAWEFDRLYVVTLGADGTVTTVCLRYGSASAPE